MFRSISTSFSNRYIGTTITKSQVNKIAKWQCIFGQNTSKWGWKVMANMLLSLCCFSESHSWITWNLAEARIPRFITYGIWSTPLGIAEWIKTISRMNHLTQVSVIRLAVSIDKHKLMHWKICMVGLGRRQEAKSIGPV